MIGVDADAGSQGTDQLLTAHLSPLSTTAGRWLSLLAVSRVPHEVGFKDIYWWKLDYCRGAMVDKSGDGKNGFR